MQKVEAAAVKIPALVDDIVRLSQGDLSQTTESGNHPAAARKTAAYAPVRALPDMATAGHLLLVDGNEIKREMLQHRLQRKGYVVDVAAGALDALERVLARPYDLVLLDSGSPGVGGLDLLRAVRERQPPLELPVTMLMAKDDTADVVESLNLGANDYLTHPIDFPVAQARVRTQRL